MSDDLKDVKADLARVAEVDGDVLCRAVLREVEALEAERDRLRAHISRMSAAGDKLDGWTSMEHVGAELARLNWKAVSRAALRNGEGRDDD